MNHLWSRIEELSQDRTSRLETALKLAKEFNVAANIIRAQVSTNQIGKLVVELLGDIDQLDEAIEWLRSRHITVSHNLSEIAIETSTFSTHLLLSPRRAKRVSAKKADRRKPDGPLI